jgi:hypothetical protein
MEDDRVVAGLQQLHEDIKELTRVIGANYEAVVSQNARMRRLYVTVIALAFIAMFLYPLLGSWLHGLHW